MVNYLRVYQEDMDGFLSSLLELNKELKANLICDRILSDEDIINYNQIRENLEKVNAENLLKLAETADCLDSVVDSECYKKIDNLTLEIFYNLDECIFCHENPHKKSVDGYFRNLIDILNGDSSFGYILSPTKFLPIFDNPAYHYYRVIRGIYEYLNANGYIEISRLEEKVDIADEECKKLFGYHDRFDIPSAPKVITSTKNNGEIKKELSYPNFFKSLSNYLRGRLNSSSPHNSKDKIELKEYYNPLSEEKI